MNKLMITFASLLLVAATGCPKSGGPQGQGDKPPEIGDKPPETKPGAGGGDDKKPEYSTDARKDFQAAALEFAKYEKEGWNNGACKGSAERFAAVAREHKIADAQYMVGRSYHACGMLDDADKAYRDALAIKSDHAMSISNIGEIYWKRGKKDEAKSWWETAVKADPKIVAARANLAMLLIEQLRETKDGDRWNKLEKEARDHLSSVLAVENDHLKAYVLYGLVYMEGRQKNKNRLDLAKLLLDEGAKIKEEYAPLQHAYGLYFLYRNNLSEALERFQRAVKLDPNFAEAHENVGLITLGFRKYDLSKEHLGKALELSGGKNYDALIGLGIAMRGLGDLDGSESSYKKAKELESGRGEAYFNLGVLYKDFRAAKQTDLRASQNDYRTARDYFNTFLKQKGISEADKDEAKNNIADCDKVIKQLEDFIKASAAGGGDAAGG